MPFPNKTEDKSAKNLPLQHVNSTRPLRVSRVGGNFLAELTDYFADDEDGFVLAQFGFAGGENGTGQWSSFRLRRGGQRALSSYEALPLKPRMTATISLNDDEVKDLRELTQVSDMAGALRCALDEYRRYARRMRLKEISGQIAMDDNRRSLEAAETDAPGSR